MIKKILHFYRDGLLRKANRNLIRLRAFEAECAVIGNEMRNTLYGKNMEMLECVTEIQIEIARVLDV